MAKQTRKSELDEARDSIAWAEKEGAREGLIGKIILIVMGVGFLVAVIAKIMGKI